MSSSNFEPTTYIHGSKLRNKVSKIKNKDDSLFGCLEKYEIWKERSLSVKTRDQAGIELLVQYLNEYKSYSEAIFDQRNNSAQEVLQPSILEEFFEYLFCNISEVIGTDMLRKPAKGFVDLIFNPSSIESLLDVPEYTIRKKDHDFVLGSNLKLSVSSTNTGNQVQSDIVIPSIAIECKRYLERNMLDECSGTAEKVKRATPYCKYFVVAEFLKMDKAAPEMSLIDEIYVLRRQRNSERSSKDFVPNPIYADLVIDLYSQCINHLKKIWWDPESALKEGKVFNVD
ncbi:Bpu10I family restriction endonuclease [Vibrio vulnificus]|uniref:Bpu10I family restriction endonuclease n=1 Tax=Vibrio parahaemolyticus TaxID=670 RepID=UPI00215F3638|nr:Bpu10I family restriction endonuclease [Vibrio parahaemolyticus]EHU4801459.1 Bpu10I family restriction endonuclease [Vibrio vulnificus]MCS0190596.1 Bpu10I family restriction endonuclease [Vibrio parahaemolyticus]